MSDEPLAQAWAWSPERFLQQDSSSCRDRARPCLLLLLPKSFLFPSWLRGLPGLSVGIRKENTTQYLQVTQPCLRP